MINQPEKGGVRESNQRQQPKEGRLATPAARVREKSRGYPQTIHSKRREKIMRYPKRTLVALALLTATLAAGAATAAGNKAVVNINTANADELMLLPKIGPSVAQRILEFREQNGRFKSAEDLMLVRGVGEKTFELIKPHIAVAGETTLVEKVKVPKEQTGDS